MSATCPLEPDIIAAAENIMPCLADELVRAKNYLKTQCAATGDTLYDHLADLVSWLLQHQPPDAADTFEQHSWRLRLEKFKADFPGALLDVYLPPKEMNVVIRIHNMIEDIRKSLPPEVVDEEEPELELDELSHARVPDLVCDNYHFKLAGCGLPDSECYSIYLSLKMLALKEPISQVRFFGKMLGLKANYYVAETEWTVEELDKRIRLFELEEMPGEGEGEGEEAETEEKPATEEQAAEERELLGEGEYEPPKEREPPPIPPAPQSAWEPPQPVPRERPGQGVNKKVYWVCHSPGDAWQLLPDVKPKEIAVARLMFQRCLTGDLEADVTTYPPFEGTERNYLRAQIARIAAATSISPQGYYTLGSGEEEEDIDLEEDDMGGELNLNPRYQGHTLKDLADPALTYWVHHQRHILPQGRTIWWNPNANEHPEEEEEEDVEVVKAEPERGPPLMSPLSEDGRLEGRVALWSARASAGLAPDTALVLVRSNLWPGAVAFSTTGKRSACLYVGWGQKHLVLNYSPPMLPAVWTEYPVGPEVMEITDPSFADEEAYRIAHLPPVPPPIVVEGEGEGEEEEEEEDE